MRYALGSLFALITACSSSQEIFSDSSADLVGPAVSGIHGSESGAVFDIDRETAGDATWAYQFLSVDANGEVSSVVESHAEDAIYGASTMKLFTGWAGLETKVVDDSVLDKMLTASDNKLANLVLCKVGENLTEVKANCREQDPSTPDMNLPQAGVAAEENIFDDIGLSNSFKMADGSGSNSNQLSAADLNRLLLTIKNDGKYDEFRKLLADTKKSNSTIKNHFKPLANRIFAKTGTRDQDPTIDGAKGLAGYVMPARPGGSTLVFAIICNHTNDIGGNDAAFARIETIVTNEAAAVDRE